MAAGELRLVAGLGNPGPAYERTRHNIGFMLLDRLADEYSIPLNEKKRFDAIMGRGRIEGVETLLVKPLSFMNRSGIPISRISQYHGINSEDPVIVHDDIDLALGRIQIKEKGGHGGHKGVRSVMDAFGSGDFIRLRMGVGRSETGSEVSDHVLGKFKPDEFELLDTVLARSRDAAVSILCRGAKESMNRFNRKNEH